ncbi:nucleotide exchange factor GrpE [Marinicella sp. S1101]|uniref:nucleotide exchange factor GrpE n=1 Tax=Marinicella marina TaxID=2996016 RepID=UPI002260BDE0|nr:nucleotide exchange factor GrpE [Marinicella marina]MCX7554496.1 nucleotide exchange factor GrpE [Marinicella marina]MDJ1140647.1 nucleotide exchange factor GrpE [Marinicella marina]
MTEENVNQEVDSELNQEEIAENDATIENDGLDADEEIIAELDDNELSALEQMQRKIEDLEAQLAEKDEIIGSKEDEVLRVAAEAQNLQRRLQRDLDNTRKFSNDKIIKAMIPVMDSFDKALEVIDDESCEVTTEAMIEGTQNTQKIFAKVLADNGIEIVDPVGEAFDPELHEAMSMVPSPEHEKNTIINVFQKGYLLHGRVIRAAMVVVAA